ncbi:hypothetical protein K9E24_002377 [Enterococcus faecalis]|nr:hypothetical protein OG1RF_10821 [Enterococcus faecalis OG1RF]EIB6531733.1 hypothetical protein [Enterococcus faecalis]MDV2593752.1 hypothetical protein [Enterococcus faecalis]
MVNNGEIKILRKFDEAYEMGKNLMIFSVGPLNDPTGKYAVQINPETAPKILFSVRKVLSLLINVQITKLIDVAFKELKVMIPKVLKAIVAVK